MMNQGSKTRIYNEYSAGGIVFRRSPRGLELAFLLDPFRKWTFAKGHIERGESIRAAAVREVKEEMGLRTLRVVSPLGKIDWHFRERRGSAHSPRGARVHKFVYYFLMQAPLKAQLRPQKQERITAARWVLASQAARVSGYKDVQPVLGRALDILAKIMYHKSQGGTHDKLDRV